MNRIESKVQTARRRLVLGQFGRALCITLFVALIVATLAVAAPAIWPMEIDKQTWAYGWIGGSSLVAVIAAAAYALMTAPSVTDVATEVDKRFGLRERLSSSLTLDQRDRDSDFGVALMTDADKRAGQLEVADRFALKPSKLGWLPVSLVPVLAIVLLLAEPAKDTNAKSTEDVSAAEIKQVKKVAEQLKKRIQAQRRKATNEKLKESQEIFEKVEAELNKLTDQKPVNRKEAMIAMNDLKKQLEERRQKLGSPDQMKKLMVSLKGMEAGPADKIAKQMEKGEFDKAKEMVKQLADKVRDGKLSAEEKKQLQQQIQKMKEQMQEASQEARTEKRRTAAKDRTSTQRRPRTRRSQDAATA